MADELQHRGAQDDGSVDRPLRDVLHEGVDNNSSKDVGFGLLLQTLGGVGQPLDRSEGQVPEGCLLWLPVWLCGNQTPILSVARLQGGGTVAAESEGEMVPAVVALGLEMVFQ